MKKLLFVFACLVVFMSGCANVKNFEYGVAQINNTNSKYNTTMETYPHNADKINLIINDLSDLKQIHLDKDEEPFYYAVNYRILNLQAEKLFIESQKYGDYGTTKNGFSCKPRPLIIESSSLRNSSALKGFEAVELLRKLVNKYPNEANSVGLSLKSALFLNATFYQMSMDAETDRNVINYFCPANVTLDLYQQEFRKSTNLSEEYLNNLTYNDAVALWKNIRGFS